MRIVTLETLKSMPNGTVFCQIDKWGNYEGSPDILTGRYKDRIGFNGIMDLLPCSPDGDECTNLHMFGDNQELIKDKDFPAEWDITDTSHHDYKHNQLFMVFSKIEVLNMAKALLWALSGLEGDFLNIDASEIKDDCHRFGIESLQSYLKADSPKKQDKETGKISVIVKGITKTYSIEEIGDIVRAYEDIKYCKEHDGEHLHSEEYLKIISLNRDVARLESARKRKQEEIESLKKQLDRSQTTITCLERLSAGLKADFNTATEKIKDLVNENMRLQCERNDYKSKTETLETDRMQVKLNEFSDFLPTEPIKIADMLISATYTRQKSNMEKALHKAFGNNSDTLTENVYSESDLRQIAEHLLVCCGHNEEGEE